MSSSPASSPSPSFWPTRSALAVLVVSLALVAAGCQPADDTVATDPSNTTSAMPADTSTTAPAPSTASPDAPPPLPPAASAPNPAPPPPSAVGPVWPVDARTVPAKPGSGTGQAILTAIRTGRHDTYDRLVLDFSAGFGDVSVRYVSVVRQDPSDRVVPLKGNAFVWVVVHSAVAGWGAPPAPYTGPSTVTPNYPTLKQASIAGDYEAVLSFGIGLDRVAGFQVSRLTGPDRLVIDFAQRPAWQLWPEDSLGQARSTRTAFEQGHQPWRGNPVEVVRAYAVAVYAWSNPTITRMATNNYRVIDHGDSITVTTTAPFGNGSVFLIDRTR